MNTFSFPQISVNYKDADAAKRTLVNSSRVSYDIFKEAYDECMQHHEECWVMFLNQANRLLGLSCISKCGISQTVGCPYHPADGSSGPCLGHNPQPQPPVRQHGGQLQ